MCFSLKFHHTKTHPRGRSTSFVREDETQKLAKDTIILEVNWAHRCIRLSSVGISIFVKNADVLELIEHEI